MLELTDCDVYNVHQVTELLTLGKLFVVRILDKVIFKEIIIALVNIV